MLYKCVVFTGFRGRWRDHRVTVSLFLVRGDILPIIVIFVLTRGAPYRGPLTQAVVRVADLITGSVSGAYFLFFYGSLLSLSGLCQKRHDHISTLTRPMLVCKGKRQYLLTCKLSRYCLSALHGIIIRPHPANMRCWPNVGLQLSHRLRRWPTVNQH